VKLWHLIYEFNGREEKIPIWDEPRPDVLRVVILAEKENELVLKAIKGPGQVEIKTVDVPHGYKFPRTERLEVSGPSKTLAKPKERPKTTRTSGKKRGRKKKK